MDTDTAATIITYVVECTKPRWSEYEQSWKDIDRLFIQHGYEQQGFQIFKLVPIFEELGIYSIDAIGSIWLPSSDPEKYVGSYARGLDSPFYRNLESGQRGETAARFFQSIKTFFVQKRGSPGRCPWRLLWCLLVACSYLRTRYNSSFAEYIRTRYQSYSGLADVSDEMILGLSDAEWEAFKNATKPWNELKGVGPNAFDFIFRDIAEAHFADSLFKSDSSNSHFLKVTGISKLIPSQEHRDIIQFLEGLPIPYNLAEINKGIYTYCSRTESGQYGFCRSSADCRRCGIAGLCDCLIE